MIILPRRFHVGQVLTFLAVFMIFFNIYTFTIVTGGNQRHENFRSISDTSTTSHGRNRHNLNPPSMVIDDVSSVRFTLAEDKSLILHIPKRLRQSPINDILYKIQASYNRIQTERSLPSHGHIKVLARVQKALKGNLSTRYHDKSLATNTLLSFSEWPFHIDSFKFQRIGDVLRIARQSKIITSKNSKRGTQLKVEVTLEGGQIALFKPKWHSNDVIVTGDAYSGRDRHYGEIAAFYLNLLLGYNQAPITVGRRVHLKKEIYHNAENGLYDTFHKDNRGNLCFYGVCYYCTSEEFVCAEGNYLDGALILLLGKKLRTVSSPWKRAYSKSTNSTLPWETDPNYCAKVMKDGNSLKRQEAILDLTAVAVFDFLIGNADRHRLELYVNQRDSAEVKSHTKTIALIDNGKSFGNPFEDYIDILAPLYECCKIRRSLLNTLKKFRGVLGKSFDTISNFDALHPLVTKAHLEALDRRLLIVLSAVQVCLDHNLETGVILQ